MESKSAVVQKYGRKPGDTGSSEVQVALLTERIRHISRHLETRPKDHSTRRGLLKLVGERRRMLRYLARKSQARYHTLIEGLGLRK